MARLLALLLLASSAALPLRPVPERLAPWTTALREQQPENPFVAVYRIGRHRLVFVAAQHDERNDSPTFRVIRAAYAAFRFDTVIAEGFPASWGINPARVVDDALNSVPASDGFVEGGETVPTIVGAHAQGAAIIGGEQDDLDIKAQVLATGFDPDDLLGFYVLRNIPQWIEERKIADVGDPRLEPLIVKALIRNRERLGLPSATLTDFRQWSAWYRAANRKPLDAGFSTEEAGPLADGRFATNKIAYAVSRARDAYLHGLIITHLNAGKNVLVVFGGSHLMIHRPALDAVLGPPCYVGAEIKPAVLPCK